LLSDNQTLFCFVSYGIYSGSFWRAKQYGFGNKVTKRSRLVTSQCYNTNEATLRKPFSAQVVKRICKIGE